MGYQNGLGLGKNKQGITDPVSLLANPGKCGLGHQFKQTAFTESTDFQDEVKSILETSFIILSFTYYDVSGNSYRAESSMVRKHR